MSAPKALQRLIDRAASTGVANFRAQAALNEWCIKRYGFEPGDVDADEIIDTVLGGCGEPCVMDAADFDRIMTDAKAERGEQ